MYSNNKRNQFQRRKHTLKEKMKFLWFFVALVVCIQLNYVCSHPDAEFGDQQNTLDLELVSGYNNAMAATGELYRQKRLTCSIGGFACSAHCRLRGRNGGYCSRGICRCK